MIRYECSNQWLKVVCTWNTLGFLNNVHVMCYAAMSLLSSGHPFSFEISSSLSFLHPNSGVQMLFFLSKLLPSVFPSNHPNQSLTLNSSSDLPSTWLSPSRKILRAQNSWLGFDQCFFPPSLLLSESPAIAREMWVEYKLLQFNRLIKVI